MKKVENENVKTNENEDVEKLNIVSKKKRNKKTSLEQNIIDGENFSSEMKKSEIKKIDAPKKLKEIEMKPDLKKLEAGEEKKLIEGKKKILIEAPEEKLLLEREVETVEKKVLNQENGGGEKEETAKPKRKKTKKADENLNETEKTEEFVQIKKRTRKTAKTIDESQEKDVKKPKNKRISKNVSRETLSKNDENLDKNFAVSSKENEIQKSENDEVSLNFGEENLTQNSENKSESLKQKSLDEKIKKKVLFVTSEAQPFCATGGLADVAGTLPKAVKEENEEIEVRTIMPLYSNIPNFLKNQFKFLGYKYTTLAWRRVYCGVFEYTFAGVKYYFIDNEQYFKRDAGVYGYFDDAERFAFFSKAVLEILPLIGYFPDIIHTNDWESALIPVYLKTIQWDDKRYYDIKTILTIHNIQYQGRYSNSVLVDVFGIDEKYSNILSFDGDVNILKGGIICCDKLTTVSPSYAEEIKSPEFSGGLHNIICENSYKLTGILNGLDYDFYNPETDDVIYANFSKNNFNNRAKNKLMIQREFGLEENLTKPMVAFCSRMTFLKGFELIKNCIEKLICENNFQFVGVGSGEKVYEDFFRYLNSKYPKNVHISVGYSLELGRKIYSGADIYIMPSITEPCGLSQLVACRYGVVPIVRETGGLKDTVRDFGNLGGGNGYTFKSKDTADLEYSIRRAVADYSDRAEWTKKVENVMSLDFSWKKTAKNYIDLYNSLY